MKTMKQIKNIRQLMTEKKRLAQRQAELEKAIKYDWRDVKESITPQNIGEQVLGSVFSTSSGKDSAGILAESLSQLAAGFTRKTVQKAEEKIKHWFNKH
jgi:hypothetical protein